MKLQLDATETSLLAVIATTPRISRFKPHIKDMRSRLKTAFAKAIAKAIMGESLRGSKYATPARKFANKLEIWRQGLK